jgi:hypothetical protein
MPALLPIATANVDLRTKSCLLIPEKGTGAVQLGMSVTGQRRTSSFLLDYFVSEQQERLADRETKRFGGFKIDRKLKFVR